MKPFAPKTKHFGINKTITQQSSLLFKVAKSYFLSYNTYTVIKIKNTKNKKKIITGALLLIIVGAGLFYFYHAKNDAKDKTSSVNGVPATSTDGINYQPATDSEKSDSENSKAAAEEQSKNDSSQTSGMKKVTPVVTYSGIYQGNVEVSSYVPGVLENSGKCTLTLTMGSKKVSQSKDASPNVSDMSCGLIKISESKLSSGSWTGIVSYSSSKASGSSDKFNIDIK